jgi:hypothetical protein
MTLEEFNKSLNNKLPPNYLNDSLISLWYDQKGDWEKAHQIAQKKEGEYEYDRIHAYLHRKEGDLMNAKYWYRRIEIQYPVVSLAEEADNLIIELLQLNK